MQNTMDVNMDLLQSFIHFLLKKNVWCINKKNYNKELAEEKHKRIRKFKKEKYTHLLHIIFVVQM